ncbi:hypothetical protein ACVV4J_26435 [Escherichia coli]
MTIFNGLLEAKKARSKTARSRRWPSPSPPLTKSCREHHHRQIVEAYPDHGDNYFKPKIWEDARANRAQASVSLMRRLPQNTVLMAKNG